MSDESLAVLEQVAEEAREALALWKQFKHNYIFAMREAARRINRWEEAIARKEDK